MFECDGTCSKNSGFDVKYTINKQTNKQTNYLKKTETSKQIIRIMNLVSFEPQCYVG